MIKNFLLSFCLLLSFISFSQSGTSSPYSFYGIGEKRFIGTIESRSMGGLSIIPDSTRINFQNPAGFGNIKWTNFAVGVSTDFKNQKSNDEEASTRRTTLDYIAVSIPLGKFGAGFGLMPYSSVGYNIQNISENTSQNNAIYNGWGGINRVFLGAGYRILPNLSFGATAYYNFGKINTSSVEFIPEITTGSRELNVKDLSGLSVNLGLMYQYKLKEKLTLLTSLYYTPKSTLATTNNRVISTVNISPDFDFAEIDPSIPVITTTNVRVGQKWALGLGLGNTKKWAVGAELTIQDMASLNSAVNPASNASYGKNQRFGFGGYYTPAFTQFSNYAKRITYRGGFVYEKTGLLVNSQSIDDVGFTFGAGLPVSGSLSNINFGLQVGKRGTTANNLVQENYIVLSLGFSLNDKWFIKSKYR